MKRVVAVIALVAMVVLSGYAQQDVVMKAKIPFSFIAAGKTLPAGDYEFKVTQDRDAIAVRNIETGATANVIVMTRLAPETISSAKAHITFDQVGGKSYLEVIWPGVEDGYLINITKEKHKHQTVKMG